MLTAQEIKAIRLALGLKLTQFAARLGVGESTAWRWETGDTHPRWDTMVKINAMRDELEKDLAAAGPTGEP